jgi:hypothetical protein
LRQSKSLVRALRADHSITNKTRCARPFERRRYIKDSKPQQAHLAALLKQSGSGATVDQFLKFIYEKGSVISLGDYVSVTFRQFPTRRRDVDVDTRLSVLTDAWDYSPHRACGGKCPAELISELEN